MSLVLNKTHYVHYLIQLSQQHSKLGIKFSNLQRRKLRLKEVKV